MCVYPHCPVHVGLHTVATQVRVAQVEANMAIITHAGGHRDVTGRTALDTWLR